MDDSAEQPKAVTKATFVGGPFDGQTREVDERFVVHDRGRDRILVNDPERRRVNGEQRWRAISYWYEKQPHEQVFSVRRRTVGEWHKEQQPEPANSPQRDIRVTPGGTAVMWSVSVAPSEGSEVTLAHSIAQALGGCPVKTGSDMAKSSLPAYVCLIIASTVEHIVAGNAVNSAMGVTIDELRSPEKLQSIVDAKVDAILQGIDARIEQLKASKTA